MIIDYENRIVFLATRKVASTSIQQAFGGFPQVGKIIGNSKLKHIDFSTFIKISEPLGLTQFSTIAPIRHPFDKAVSWFKFRSREKKRGARNYLGDKSFPDYLQQLREKEISKICDRYFVTDAESQRQVDYVVKYEDIQKLWVRLQEIYGEDFLVEKRNVSPNIQGNYEESRGLFEELFEAEIKWYEGMRTSDLTTLAASGVPERDDAE